MLADQSYHGVLALKDSEHLALGRQRVISPSAKQSDRRGDQRSEGAYVDAGVKNRSREVHRAPA